MKVKFPFLIGILFILTALQGYAQDTFEYLIPAPPPVSIVPEFPEPLPRQFRGFSLGSSLETLEAALVRDHLLHFRGPRDVSFLPIREQTLVETTGSSFIRRAHFQLDNEIVYIMSFTLDTRLVDHFSVFTAFVRRYGEPVILNPREAVWESGETRVSIERPLTVKYIDRLVFDRLIEESRELDNWQLFLREDFLADF